VFRFWRGVVLNSTVNLLDFKAVFAYYPVALTAYITKNLRINRQIYAPSVRLIGADGEQLGIVSKDRALALAEEATMDLAEVAPNENPPVCKILDYGKYQYYQRKIEAKHKRLQKKAEMKGIRLGFKIGDHDLMVKVNQAKKFLENRCPVKVVLILKGREVVYRDLAIEKMKKFYEALAEICTVEESPKRQGNMLLMILTPKT
jgi:translation initiation factor IF-3